MKRLYQGLAIATLCLITTMCGAQTPEFRGLYVDAFHPGLRTHQEVTQMVKAAKAANFNALIVQVRKRGDAYYNSHVEPRSADIAADYDPLADVIRQAHAVGLEVHAMLAVCEVAHESYDLPETHVLKKHPEWLMVMKDDKTVQFEGKIFLDPCIPDVQEYLVSIVEDVVKNYDVDGIHLEGCRYIRREAMYNKIVLDLYAKVSGKTDVPKYDDPEWSQWRRSQVTGLVRKIHDRLASTKPAVKLSASVMTPTPALASEYALQDWGAWMQEGLVDFTVPMLYVDSDTVLSPAVELLKVKGTRHMYLGVGTFQLTSAKARQHILDARAAGVDGVVLFSYHYLVGTVGNETLAKAGDLSSVFSQPSARPAMSWRMTGTTGSEAGR